MDNPYTPPSHCGEHGRTGASILFGVLLVIAALNMLVHGALMVFEYSSQFANMPSNGDYFASNFGRAMFLKDSVSGLSALLAAILIFCRHRLGWWMALIHWHWYLIWSVIIVITAESFGWQLPVRYEPSEIAAHIARCLIYSFVAIAFFNLKPILRILNLSIKYRFTTIMAIFVGTASLGFLINWWSGIR